MVTGRVKSLIEGLDSFVPQRDRHQVVEARASNVIASTIHLLELIEKTFEEDEASELQKRLIGAIKNKDPDKFNRKIRDLRKIEEREKKKHGKRI